MENSDNEQELIQRATSLHQQSEELDQHIEFLAKQQEELEEFLKTIEALGSAKENSSLSYLGKGVYMKTQITEKDLFVNVGANVILRKTPEETILVLKDQIKRINEMKTHAQAQLELFHSSIAKTIEEIESIRQK